MEFQLVFDTQKSVDGVISALEKALSERNFGVLWHLNVNQKLAEKGFAIEPDVHILEVCGAGHAKRAIDTNSAVAAFLPCKITVKQEGGQTQLILLRPTLMIHMLGDERLQPLADEVENALVEAISAAC